MSRVLNAVRRVGSQAHKYQFILSIEKLQFSKPQTPESFLGDALDASGPLSSSPSSSKGQQSQRRLASAQVPSDVESVGFQYQWTRGPRTASSTVLLLTKDMFKHPVSASNQQKKGVSSLDWGVGNQVTLMATLYTDGKTGLIQSKKSKLGFRAAPEGYLEHMKTFGFAELDLAQFAVRPDDPHFGENTDAEKSVAGVKVNLRKCNDPGAYVVLNVKSVLVRGGVAASIQYGL
jgi:hypothetical protein